MYVCIGKLKRKKESWNNNTLDFQVVSGSAVLREVLLKTEEYVSMFDRNIFFYYRLLKLLKR